MSAPQKTIFDYDAELINLRMMAIFLFLLSTSLGVTFGSIVGVSSFEHHHRIPMALFIAISTSLAILLSLIALLRWWYYSGERFPPKYELYIHNYPIGMVRGSTEWRKFMLGYDSSMSFNRKIGIWITWLVYHLVRVADKIFGHGLPPSSYVEAARVEEGGVEMEVEVLGGSRSRRMALRGDENGESFNSATSVENGHRYSEDPARPSMTYDESYGLGTGLTYQTYDNQTPRLKHQCPPRDLDEDEPRMKKQFRLERQPRIPQPDNSILYACGHRTSAAQGNGSHQQPTSDQNYRASEHAPIPPRGISTPPQAPRSHQHGHHGRESKRKQQVGRQPGTSERGSSLPKRSRKDVKGKGKSPMEYLSNLARDR